MKRIVFSLIFFVFITANLYALKNDYFEVNDEGMKTSEFRNVYSFDLKLNQNNDYSIPSGNHPIPPTISIRVEPLKGERPRYDSMETSENIAKEHLKSLKDIDKRLNSFSNYDYVLDRVSIERFGDNMAFYHEITKESRIYRVYTIATKKNFFTISITSTKGDNFKDTQAYRRFVNSFVIVDSQPRPVKVEKAPPPPREYHTSKAYANAVKRANGEPIKEKNHLIEALFTILVLLLGLIAAKIKKSL